jgi:hypothetical protein
MKKIVLICLTAFLFNCCNLFSQGLDTASYKKIKRISRWSLQFEVGYNFDLKSFQNLMFTTKYTFTPVTAIRFGPGAAFENEENELEADEQIVNSRSKYYDFRFVADLLFFPNPRAVIMFYIGFGPQLNYIYNYNETVESDLSKRIRDEYRWGAGINLVAGGEWFAFSNLSFFAEYNVSGIYQKGEAITYMESIENIITDRVKAITKGIIIRPEDARLGISLYF